MDRWGIPTAGLLLFCLLCWYSIQFESSQIEQDLTARSMAALHAAGIEIPPYGLKISGQTAILSGPAGSPIVSEEARMRVEAILGISDVTVNARDGSGPPSAPTPQPVTTHTDDVPKSSPASPQQPASPDGSALESEIAKYLEGKSIRFSSNRDVLLSEGRRVLDGVIKLAAAAPQVPLEIVGHTDADGDAKKNVDLSKRRAAAVKRYLVSRGIPAARLTSTGYGAEKPIASGSTPEDKARNRRIEFHALRNQ